MYGNNLRVLSVSSLRIPWDLTLLDRDWEGLKSKSGVGLSLVVWIIFAVSRYLTTTEDRKISGYLTADELKCKSKPE